MCIGKVFTELIIKGQSCNSLIFITFDKIACVDLLSICGDIYIRCRFKFIIYKDNSELVWLRDVIFTFMAYYGWLRDNISSKCKI